MLKDHNAGKPVRLEPGAPQSPVKHSTTALPISSVYKEIENVLIFRKTLFITLQMRAYCGDYFIFQKYAGPNHELSRT